jgi:hypothetical protein
MKPPFSSVELVEINEQRWATERFLLLSLCSSCGSAQTIAWRQLFAAVHYTAGRAGAKELTDLGLGTHLPSVYPVLHRMLFNSEIEH